RSVRDALTGLYHRAHFLEELGPLVHRSARRGLGISVIMLDIDHFKTVNDTYGHPAGDLVLSRVAALIRRSTRTDDLVARYGGEEVIVALPIAAPDLASERADRIRLELAEERIDIGGSHLSITASLGLTFAPANRPRP